VPPKAKKKKPLTKVSDAQFCYISHIIQLTPQEQSAEPKNSARAKALTVARRPKEASSEKTRPPPVSSNKD